MTVRASMADLISRVRLLVADPAGASQVFDDQTVQNALDRHQIVVRYAELRAEPTFGAAGLYQDYYAGMGDWEADEVLYDAAYIALTPSAADRLTGHWTFEAGQLPPVYIVGKSYDVYAAAADLLEAWAAKEKLSFDFNADGQAFQRSQKARALLSLAAQYRRQQRPVSVTLVRGDANCYRT